MFVNGVPDFSKKTGKEQKTGILVGRAMDAADVRTTTSGKQVASLNLRAYGKKDGTVAYITVKSWDAELIDQMAFILPGDKILAAGRLEFREYNGKTYVDLVADFLMIQRGRESAVPAAPAPQFDQIPEEEEPGELPF